MVIRKAESLCFFTFLLFHFSFVQVGLAVEPDWYNVMLKKFQFLLDKMEASDMPETAQYRIDVTKWCNFVIATAKANPDDPEAVEDAVQMGQVEELIEMADDEMVALDTYLSSRMWELVAAANPPVVDLNPDPMRDPFGADGNFAEQEAIRKGMESKPAK
jgi:ETC complex I subunit conserved region